MRSVVLFVWAGILAHAAPSDSSPSWIARSNENAKLLLSVEARYAPEGAGSLGVSGLDEQISVPAPDLAERARRDTEKALQTLRSRIASEQDSLVKQDLEILIQAGERDNRLSLAEEKYLLPYQNISRTIFFGIHSLLDDQIAPERRKAAVVRLRRYAGLEAGYTPITVRAENVFREKLKTPGLLGPAKAEVEQDIANLTDFSSGIGLLLEKYNMTGYQDAYAKLKTQLSEYSDFLRKEVLPKARSDFRLPPELYAIGLENFGVDYTPAELTRLAHQSFTEIQNEMKPLAAKIAKERHLPSSDYRDVIRELKKDQVSADRTLPLYKERLSEIESIIRREHLVTLPDRPAIIRLATPAETAQQPAPHMRPPRLIGNHGEQGQFVLPLTVIGKTVQKYDDFNYDAGAWTLTAHEARPGHELQFSRMIEAGVSLARAMYAFNSVNVEGWGLYAEAITLPFMPDEGKLISLQLRLQRAARAFVDPELQAGKWTPAAAREYL